MSDGTPSSPLAGGLSQEALTWSTMMAALPPSPRTEPDDLDGWRAATVEPSDPRAQAAIGMATTGAVPTGASATALTVALSNTSLHIASLESLLPRDRRVLLSIHGGGFTVGGGAACKVGAELLAATLDVSVAAVDYRMPPGDRAPAALDDCVDAYRFLLGQHDPVDLAVSGVSAGGNLAAAMLLRARAEGLPMPAALVLVSPFADLTMSGDSIALFGDGGVSGNALLYAGGLDRTDPLLSPLFAEFDATWPPTLLTTGTRDFLLSDTIRMHRALLQAGVDARLEVFEALPHGGFGGTAPEDREVAMRMRGFLNREWTDAMGPRR